ncbi:hypothetical protein BASA62_004240 [Batrachochytrium salamandrivorans]|nr:hypothetical protein BASA62_004240 [Batrachochytrium salamandrivorans]
MLPLVNSSTTGTTNTGTINTGTTTTTEATIANPNTAVNANVSVSTPMPIVSTPRQPLIEVVGIGTKLVLDNVYLNSLHALHRLEIRNISNVPVRVKMRSNLASQIAFQLTNENLPDNDGHMSTRNMYLRASTSTSISGSAAFIQGATASQRGSTVARATQSPSTSTSPRITVASDAVHETVLHGSHSAVSTTSLDSSLDSLSVTNDSVDSPRFSTNRSSLSSSLGFTEPPPLTISDSQSFTTNTVEAASMWLSGFGTSSGYAHGHQFNQLFNYVNHIDEVLLESGQTQKIIVAFLPEVKDNRESVLTSQIPASSRLKSITGNRMDGGGMIEPSFIPQGEEEETFDFFEINGLLFFFAYKAENRQSSGNEASVNSIQGDADILKPYTQPAMERRSTVSSTFISAPVGPSDLHIQGTDYISATKTISTEPICHEEKLPENSPANNVFFELGVDSSAPILPSTESDPTSGIPDYQLTIKLRSRVCRSMLWTDIGSTGLIFDDCVVGGSYFKDFTIWNRSEIDLFWCLNTIDLSNQNGRNWLKFTDYNTGDAIENTPVPAYSHRRIRVTFKPRETGELNYDLQIENQNDSSNTVETRIHAIVHDVLREETLVINSGSMIDFGDCCAGLWRKRHITIKNTSNAVLDVLFQSDSPGVVFQLKSDDVSAETPETTTQQQHFHRRRHQQHQQLSLTDASDGGAVANNIQYSPVVSNQLQPDIILNHPDRPAIDRLQDISATFSGPSSELSPTQSSTSSRASSPLLQRKRTNSGMLLSGVSSGASITNNNIGVGGKGSSIIEAIELTRITSNSSSFDLSEEIDNAHTVDLPQRDALGVTTEDVTLIEEVQLRAGMERTIEVCYKPTHDPMTPDYRAGRLTKRNFRINLMYAHPGQQTREKKTIQAVSRTCTSFIEISPQILNFGDTNVNTLRSLPIKITNCSELSARVELRFVSKVLNSFRGEMTIHARQHIEVKVDIYPRKINPDYCKQITVVNLLNRDNDHIVDVRSTNIDKHRVTFHSLFYHILTPSSTNFVDFGSVILNSSVVRTFTIENISRKMLSLEITSSMPNDIRIFTKSTEPMEKMDSAPSASSAVERREKLLETLDDGRMMKRPTVDALSGGTNNTGSTGSILGLAGVSKPGRVIDETTTSLHQHGESSSAYLDLASTLDGPGRRSPRRKPPHVTQTAELKLLRKHYNRERKPLFAEEDLGARASANRGIKYTVTNVDDDPFSVSENSAMAYSSKRPLATSDHSAVLSETNPTEHVDDEHHTGPDDPLSLLFADVIQGSKLTIDALLLLIEKSTGVLPPLFPRASLEENYAKSQLMLKREFESAIEGGRLSPTSIVNIEPESSVTIILVLKALGSDMPHVQGKPRKHDAHVFLRMQKFDMDIKQPQFEQLLRGGLDAIPVRELMLRISLYRSIMELGQKNINFGVLDKNERRNKSIVIRNNSEAPLLYTIRKSGSIASGDIILGNHRMGVVRGYGKREVEFIFDPSLAGVFQEKLIVENILDRKNDQIMTLKANIRQPANFAIETLLLEFGACLVDNPSSISQEITISNTSQKHTRTFEIRVDPKELIFENFKAVLKFELVEDDADFFGSGDAADSADALGHTKSRKRPVKILSSEIEELIEQAEQKLKIAKRKGRKDKIKRLTDKLDKLRSGEVLDEYATDKHENSNESPVKGSKELQKTSISVITGDTILPDLVTGVITDDPEAGIGALRTSVVESPICAPDSSLFASAPDSKADQTSSSVTPSATQSINSIKAPPGKSDITADDSLPGTGVLRVKKTNYSITVTIEPRCIKSVKVFFTPVHFPTHLSSETTDRLNNNPPKLPIRRSTAAYAYADIDHSSSSVVSYSKSETDGISPMSTLQPIGVAGGVCSQIPNTTTVLPSRDLCKEVFIARIYVHEQKNTDVVKRVLCKAVVCFDHSTYLQELAKGCDYTTTESYMGGRDKISSISEFDRAAVDFSSVSAFQRVPSPLSNSTTTGSSNLATSNVIKEPAHIAMNVDAIGGETAAKGMTSVTPSSFLLNNDKGAHSPPSDNYEASRMDVSFLLGQERGSLDCSAKSTTLEGPASESSVMEPSFIQAPSHPFTLSVEVPLVDLGKLEIGERKDAYATITNGGDVETRFSFSGGPEGLSDLLFPLGIHILQPMETRRFDLTILPTQRGLQTCTARLVGIVPEDTLDVIFVYYGIRATYLHFPTLTHSKNTLSAVELDFGNCYVDPSRKYATIRALEVENLEDHDIFVSASSNLTQQCFIFSDGSLDRPMTDILMGPREVRTIFIALQPSLAGGSANSQPSSKKMNKNSPFSSTGTSREMASHISNQIDCRTLIGGIKFVVQIRDTTQVKYADKVPKCMPTPEGIVTLITQTLKFTATIGQSLLMVSHGLINFGVSTSINMKHMGCFWIYNLSPRLPLNYELRVSSPNLWLSKVCGVIDGASIVPQNGATPDQDMASACTLDPDTYTHAPSIIPSNIASGLSPSGLSTQLQNLLPATWSDGLPLCDRIDFVLIPTSSGFIHEIVDVININNSMQQVRVEIRHFVDPLCLSLSGITLLPPIDFKESTITKPPQSQLEFRPAVKWDTIYVGTSGAVSDMTGNLANSLAVQKKYRVETPPSYERSFEIENISQELLHIQPMSAMYLTVRWIVGNGSGFIVEHSDAHGSSSSNDGDVAPMPPAPGHSSLTLCGATLLLHPNEKVTLVLSVPCPRPVYEDDIWSAIVAGKKVIQDGMLLLQNIDLGTTIKMIELSAGYCISNGEVTPTAVDLGKVGHFSMWREVPFSFTIINLSDCPFQYEIEMPDVIDVTAISGQTDLGAFKRCIEPLGRHTVDAVFKPRNVDLPTLGSRVFPITIVNVFNARNTITCNVSALLTQFELRFDRLKSCLGSPTPHSWEVSLCPPRGTIEIKVRASELAGSRLTANETTSKYLTNSDGITLGTLWITSKNQAAVVLPQGELSGPDISHVSASASTAVPNMRMTETIPIRGTIIEGQTFTLSHQRVEFQSVMLSDSELDDNNESPPSEHVSATHLLLPQCEDVVITNISREFDLEFKIMVETPIELASTLDKIRIHPLDSNMAGRVDPGGLEDTFGSLKPPKEPVNIDAGRVAANTPIGLFEPFRPLDANISEGVKSMSNTTGVHWDGDGLSMTGNVVGNVVGAGTAVNGSSARGISSVSIPNSANPYGQFVSEDDDLPFSDSRSGTSLGRSIGTSSRHMSVSDSMPSASSRRSTGFMVLRGCKKVADAISGEFEGLYELDLGQQDLGQTSVPKKIVIENTSGSRVHYRLGSITENDHLWMVFSRSDGILEAPRTTTASSGLLTSHTITLNFMVSVRGMFSTYLLVENIDNRRDTKIIRVSVEVVAKHNVRRSAVTVSNMTTSPATKRMLLMEPNNNRAFDVFTEGLDWNDSTIDIGPAYLGCVYSSRSLIICNRESVPLEFSFKSNLTYDNDSEMLFSLSPTNTKLFCNLTVEPESSARVCIHFWPGQSMPSTKGPSISSASRPSKSLVESAAVEKLVEIYINCRLVKDHQKTILFRAQLCQPQIMLSKTVFLYSGMIRSKMPVVVPDVSDGLNAQSQPQQMPEPAPSIIQFSPVADVFSVTNLLHDTLEYEILTDGVYFSMELVDSGLLPDATHMDNSGQLSSAASVGNTFVPSPTRIIRPQLAGFPRPLWTSTGLLSLGPMQSQQLRIVPLMDAISKNVETLKKEKYLLEHMVVYNKRRPSEKYSIHIKMSFGNVEIFHFASGSRLSFFSLESHIIRLIHELESMPAMYFDDCNLTPESIEKADNVHFLYIYVIDELIHYGTREHGTATYLQLATLLFTMIFSQTLFKEFAPATIKDAIGSDARIWPSNLLRWVVPFTNFMEHFPHRLITMEPLKMLARSLVLDHRKPVVSGGNSSGGW